jgi:kynurenine formamidase
MAELIDVSMVHYNGMTGFPVPWVLDFELVPTATHSELKRSVMKIVTSTHTGTHIDAPFHFYEDGATLDEYPVDSFIGNGYLLDLSHLGPRGEITSELLEKATEIQAGDILLLRTDWSEQWGHEEYFSDHPYLTESGARWLIEHEIKGIGVEAGTVEDVKGIVPGQLAPVHRLVLGAGIFIIEGLTNLKEVREGKIEVLALPLKLAGSDGAPARVVVRVP